MAFAIGFGSTEQAFEQSEEDVIRAHVAERFNAQGMTYFTDAFTQEIEKWVKERGEALKAKDAEYKHAADYPERYGSYWSSVLSDASNLVVILNFMHTNRRHALSQDGWACMMSKRLFAVNTWDDIKSRREAA